MPSSAFWKLQFMGWGGFTFVIFAFFWPRQGTLSALGVQSLRILLSIIASFLLYPLCHYAFRTKKLFVPMALSALTCAAALALINEFIAQSVSHVMLGVPQKVFPHSVLTASLRYQFVLEAWCSCYFAIKLVGRAEQQADLMRQARTKQGEGLIASYRYQLPSRLLSQMLHGIARSITEGDSLHSSLMIARFGELLRNMLDSPERHWATLYEEITHSREYLDLQRDLLRRKLQVEFEVDRNLGNLPIPRWLLVPLIEEFVAAMEGTDISSLSLRIKISAIGHWLRLDLIIASLSRPDGSMVELPLEGMEQSFEATLALLETVYDAGIFFERNKDAVTLLRIELPPRSNRDGSAM